MPAKVRRLILAATGGVVLLAAAGAVAIHTARPPEPSSATARADKGKLIAGAFEPPHAAPDFTLTGSDGSTVSLARYRGKIVLMTFGFTYCAAVCPTTLATLAQARRRLGEQAEQVQVVFVTVDPARDEQEHLRRYLAAFDPSFVGATGSAGALADLRKSYGVTAARRGAGPDYAMDHTTSIFLIDRAGKLRAMMPFGHDAADFVHDIGLLLAH